MPWVEVKLELFATSCCDSDGGKFEDCGGGGGNVGFGDFPKTGEVDTLNQGPDRMGCPKGVAQFNKCSVQY